MGVFDKILGNKAIVRCDEAEFLIWRYKGKTINSGTTIVVKEGEVAVLIGSSQIYVEGPSTQTTTEKLSDVYFINIAGSNVVRFVVPYFYVNDPRWPDLPVPVAVRGSINFGIEDGQTFAKMHRLTEFDMEAFQIKIKDAVAAHVKAFITNVPANYQIPLVQMEKEILDISEYLRQYLTPRLAAGFAVNVRSVDLNAIELDDEDKNYKELRSLTQEQAAEKSQTQHEIDIEKMKTQSALDIEAVKAVSALNLEAMKEIQSQDLQDRSENLKIKRGFAEQDLQDRGENLKIKRDLAEKTTVAQIEELKKSGRMAMGNISGIGQGFGNFNSMGMNPVQNSGINKVEGFSPQPLIGQTSGINMAPPAVSYSPTPHPQVPPQIPQVAIFVAIGGQQQGPFDYAMLKQMVQTGGLTDQTLVWKEGLQNWTPAIEVPEVASILNAPQVPSVPSITPPGVPPTL